MQTRPPRDMIGRMMSIFMFSSQGLLPVSQAISGAATKWDLNLMFASAGAIAMLVTMWTAFLPEFKVFSQSLVSSAK